MRGVSPVVQSTASQGASTVGTVAPQILSAKCADVNDVNIVLYNPGQTDFSETANARVIYGSVDKLVSASLSVPAGGTQTLTLDTDLNASGPACAAGNTIEIEIYTSAGTIKYKGKLG